MKIIMLAAVTIDGKLARNSAHFVDWTSKEDKRIFSSTTRQSGALILGHNTYRTLLAPLPGRLHIVLTHSPAAKESVPGEVEYTADTPERIVAGLVARGYTEAVLGGGAQVNALFLQSNLVDEIWLTIEPVIFGLGLDLLHGIQFDLHATLIRMERLNESGAVHLRYSLR